MPEGSFPFICIEVFIKDRRQAYLRKLTGMYFLHLMLGSCLEAACMLTTRKFVSANHQSTRLYISYHSTLDAVALNECS
jgi:hypothetical protein